MSTSYDQGFADGLLFVANLLRRSALIIEAPAYSDFSHSNGKSVRAIAQTGSPQLAAKYREVAALLESATKDSQQ